MPLLTIAKLTLYESVRRRLLLAVVILTVVVIGLTGWAFSHVVTITDSSGQRLGHSELMLTCAGIVLLIAYMFSFVLAIAAAFLAAPAISSDIESGLVLAILPRPLRRSDFVIGRWLGLAVLLASYAALGGGLELVIIDFMSGYVPPHPILAIAALIGESIVIMSLALYFSTRLSPITGGIIALVLFGLAWIGGIVGAVGAAFSNTGLMHAGTIVSLLLPTDGLWRGAIYNLEPAALIALGSATAATRASPFTVIEPPTTAYLLWSLAWIVVVVALTIRSFSRRDL